MMVCNDCSGTAIKRDTFDEPCDACDGAGTRIRIAPVRYAVHIPFSCDPDKSYVAGFVTQGKGHFWYMERDGKQDPQRFKHPAAAISEMVARIELERGEMLQQEWDASGI